MLVHKTISILDKQWNKKWNKLNFQFIGMFFQFMISRERKVFTSKKYFSGVMIRFCDPQQELALDNALSRDNWVPSTLRNKYVNDDLTFRVLMKAVISPKAWLGIRNIGTECWWHKTFRVSGSHHFYSLLIDFCCRVIILAQEGYYRVIIEVNV